MVGVNDGVLKPNLCSLSKEKQRAFALILSERLIPFFSWFASQTSFGTTSIYRNYLDDAWRSLTEAVPSNWREAAQTCYMAAPHTDDFDHPLTSEALRAAISVALTMEFLADWDVAHVLESAQLANDVATFFANRRSARPPLSLTYDQLIKHPYMQKELERQLDDLAFVESLPADLTQEKVAIIKERVWVGPAR